jgi:tetratricopeptide (TPR) repeat protein
VAIACAAGIIVALSLVSVNQIGHWRDSESLYARVLAINPNSAFARAGLGRAYAESNRMADATREFEAAVRLAPTSRTAHASLAQAYLLEGRIDDAARHANLALSLAAPGEDTSWERFILNRARPSTTRPTP